MQNQTVAKPVKYNSKGTDSFETDGACAYMHGST
jgi:hypothetical protein